MGIYDELDVKSYINGLATVTAIGGSVIPSNVMDAMKEASQSFVSIVDLQNKAGAKIAEMTNNEAAMVSNGAAAAIILATAVVIAGDDQNKRDMLPFTEGIANEILVYGATRCVWESMIRQAGGKLVYYSSDKDATEDELIAAITKNTVAVFIFYFENQMQRQLPVIKVVEIAHKFDIPVIVDAAAQLPVRENLWCFTSDWGADMAIFSGGKGLCGPQSSGLVVGRKDYIDLMISFSCPNGGIGRPSKVGKEEIIGLMTAIKLFMQKDMEAEMANWEVQVRSVIDAFADDNVVFAVRDFPSEAGQPMPRAKISFFKKNPKVEVIDLVEKLRNGEPGILVALIDNSIYINPQTLKPGEIDIIIQKIKEIIDVYR